MGLPQNFKNRFFIFLALISSSHYRPVDKKHGTIGYGKEFYYDNCLSCHNFKSSHSEDAISLLDMSKIDSLSLLNKIKDLKRTEIHKNHLANKKLSDKEINSLFIYIKKYGQPVNAP